jgi:hypothetical protein
MLSQMLQTRVTAVPTTHIPTGWLSVVILGLLEMLPSRNYLIIFHLKGKNVVIFWFYQAPTLSLRETVHENFNCNVKIGLSLKLYIKFSWYRVAKAKRQ